MTLRALLGVALAAPALFAPACGGGDWEGGTADSVGGGGAGTPYACYFESRASYTCADGDGDPGQWDATCSEITQEACGGPDFTDTHESIDICIFSTEFQSVQWLPLEDCRARASGAGGDDGGADAGGTDPNATDDGGDFCGDGTCDDSEDCDACPADCGDCQGDAPVLTPCTADSQCASEWCDDWCVGTCTSNSDCVGEGPIPGACVTASDGEWYCFPNCDDAGGCPYHPGTSCITIPTIEGYDANVCSG